MLGGRLVTDLTDLGDVGVDRHAVGGEKGQAQSPRRRQGRGEPAEKCPPPRRSLCPP